MDHDSAVSVAGIEEWIVRPAQLRAGDVRLGIVALRDGQAVLQFHLGQQLPIRRAVLAVGDEVELDGWRVALAEIDPAGRGRVRVALTPPA